jgi:hypothetical protein
MTAIASAELIAELETAVSTGSPERRVLMLWRVTHLFLSSADRLNEYQIGVIDDVLVRLIQRIDARSLVQLSSTLTELTPAPKQAVRHLLATRRAVVCHGRARHPSQSARSAAMAERISARPGILLGVSARGMRWPGPICMFILWLILPSS